MTKKYHRKRKFLKALIFIAIIICFLTFAITLTINFKPLFKYSLNHLEISEESTLTKEIIYKNFSQLMSYLNSPFSKTLEMEDFPTSEDGAFHFYEVKKLFQLNYKLLIISLAFLIFAYFKWIKKDEVSIIPLRKPFLVVGLLPLLGLIFVFIDFNSLFVKFHQMFFNNDKWMFDPTTDPIIYVLPQEFFSYCFIFGFAIFEILILALVIYGFVSHRKSRKYIEKTKFVDENQTLV